MFSYNDLYQYYNPAEDSLTEGQIHRIALQADRDLASRGLFGVFVLPLIYSASALLTPYATEHPVWFWILGSILYGDSLLRFISAKKLQAENTEKRSFWQKSYMFSSLGSGLVWGGFAASSLYFYTSQPPNVYILYFLAAVAGGAVASFSTWLRLNQLYLFLLLLPAIVTSIYLWDQQVGLVGVLAVIAACYNIGVAKKWNASYWKSLINVYLLENEIAVRREAEEMAEKANSMKSEFLGNMSHEMRTPLHGLLSYAKLGYDRFQTVPREKLRDYFVTISRSGERLLLLVNDLLDLAKLESGKTVYDLKRFDLNNTIASIVMELQGLIDEKQLCVQQIPNSPLMAVFDRSKISQVLRNFLSNAIKFSPEGSTISVHCSQHNRGVQVAVRDQGVGIPNGEEEQIFDKFIQSSKTKTGAGGTGLGLAICKKIVEGHGGKIWAENNESGGTSFFFILPQSHFSAVERFEIVRQAYCSR